MSVLFIIAGLLALAGGLGVVLAKTPVHQVLSMILTFIGMAALYLSLTAEFLAVMQIIVYGGAIMVLFLFVITLLTVGTQAIEHDHGKLSGQSLAGWSVGGAILLMLAIVGLVGTKSPAVANIDANVFGGVKHFGHELLTTHMLPFELTAFVLMVAVIGVIILVGRHETK